VDDATVAARWRCCHEPCRAQAYNAAIIGRRRCRVQCDGAAACVGGGAVAGDLRAQRDRRGVALLHARAAGGPLARLHNVAVARRHCCVCATVRPVYGMEFHFGLGNDVDALG